jgi:hypothetical protein
MVLNPYLDQFRISLSIKPSTSRKSSKISVSQSFLAQKQNRVPSNPRPSRPHIKRPYCNQNAEKSLQSKPNCCYFTVLPLQILAVLINDPLLCFTNWKLSVSMWPRLYFPIYSTTPQSVPLQSADPASLRLALCYTPFGPIYYPIQ